MPPVYALALFALITISVLFIEIMYTYATQGFGYGFSSNREVPKLTPFGGRLKRTYQNQIESAAYCVPALATAAVLELNTGGIATAALLIVVGRALFVPLYLSGVPYIRVPAFGLATVSSIYIVVMALTSMPA